MEEEHGWEEGDEGEVEGVEGESEEGRPEQIHVYSSHPKAPLAQLSSVRVYTSAQIADLQLFALLCANSFLNSLIRLLSKYIPRALLIQRENSRERGNQETR